MNPKNNRKSNKNRDFRKGQEPKREPKQKERSNLEKVIHETMNKCVYQRKCGGCTYQHLSYEKQLKEKQKTIEKLLGKLKKPEPIIGMENPLYYRNKVHRVVAGDKRGNCYTGIYEANSHRVVKVEKCLIENQKSDEICQTIANLMKSFKMRPYNEDTGYGFLRHILIRSGHNTGQYLVTLVTSSPVFPSKNNFVKALRQKHPEITSIVANVNDRHTSMILGEKEQILYGKGYIEDILCGKTFRISPKSFYQINAVQTEKLYEKAIQYAELTGKETVIDAYSGIGTIGIIAAEHAGEVLSVELNKEAVKDAIANAKANNIKNIRFINADAGEFMVKMASRGQKADVVFMDPPRSGSSPSFLNALFSLQPKKIVYISCNPETLKRDLEILTKKKYRVEKIQPYDLFPATGHTECIALVQRGK